MSADALQLGSEREGEQDVGARSRREMEVGLFGDLGAQGIDDNQFAALPHRRRILRTRCRLATVALLPQTTLSLAFSAASGRAAGTTP